MRSFRLSIQYDGCFAGRDGRPSEEEIVRTLRMVADKIEEGSDNDYYPSHATNIHGALTWVTGKEASDGDEIADEIADEPNETESIQAARDARFEASYPDRD